MPPRRGQPSTAEAERAEESVRRSNRTTSPARRSTSETRAPTAIATTTTRPGPRPDDSFDLHAHINRTHLNLGVAPAPTTTVSVPAPRLPGTFPNTPQNADEETEDRKNPVLRAGGYVQSGHHQEAGPAVRLTSTPFPVNVTASHSGTGGVGTAEPPHYVSSSHTTRVGFPGPVASALPAHLSRIGGWNDDARFLPASITAEYSASPTHAHYAHASPTLHHGAPNEPRLSGFHAHNYDAPDYATLHDFYLRHRASAEPAAALCAYDPVTRQYRPIGPGPHPPPPTGPPVVPGIDRDALKGLQANIPKYDGSGGGAKYNTFVDRVETYLSIACLPDHVTIAVVTSNFTGDASVWWSRHIRDYDATSPNRIRSWPELRDTLKDRYLPPDAANRAYRQLLACRLGDYDSVAKFNTAFNRLVCQVSGVPESLLTDAYLTNLTTKDGKPSMVKSLVQTNEQHTRSLDYAMKLALRHCPRSNSTGGDKPRSDRATPSSAKQATATPAKLERPERKLKDNKRRDGKGDGKGGERPDRRRKDQPPPPCQFCPGEKHYYADCPLLKEFREHRLSRGSDAAAGAAVLQAPDNTPNHNPADDPVPARAMRARTTSSPSSDPDSIELCMDSGATNYYFPARDALTNYRPDRRPVHMADDSIVHTDGLGTMRLTSSTGLALDLHNVYHTPGLSPLFSVTTATMHGYDVEFKSTGVATIRDSTDGTVVATGYRNDDDRLFYLPVKIRRLRPAGSADAAMRADISPSPCARARASIARHSDLTLLHRRLGHLSMHPLRKAAEVLGVDIPPDTALPFCDQCALGKAKRLPFRRSDPTKAYTPLQRIDADEAGPFLLSLHGERQVLTFIDHASRMTIAYFLPAKDSSLALSCFRDYKAFMEKQYDMPILRHHSDGGSEFMSDEYTAFLRSSGIEVTTTIRHCPAQNGTAERVQGTIENRVRSILCGSHLPPYLWSEFWRFCVYVYNRTDHSAIRSAPLATIAAACNRPAPSLWTDLSLLRVPGCLAYAHVPKTERSHKLADAALRCVYLGPAVHSKGFRLWDPVANVVFERHAADFDESHLYHPDLFGLPHTPPNDAGCLSDDDRYIVHKILRHRQTDTGDYEFLIRWTGYGPADDTWEPYANLDDCDIKLRQYFARRRLPVPDSIAASAQARSALLRLWYSASDGHDDTTSLYLPEPRTFRDAMHSAEAAHWKAACDHEHANLLRMKVYVLVPCPPDRNLVSTKWVFKRKLRADNTVEKYRARWVARGFSQRPGEDFVDTFAPVLSYASMRLVLALAALNAWDIFQTDVPVAFLHSTMDKEVYATQPEGYEDPTHPDWVCLFLMALYGFKQSAHRWNDRIDSYFASRGFTRLSADRCVYVLHRRQEGDDNNPSSAAQEGDTSDAAPTDDTSFPTPACIISLYVDDITMTGPDRELMHREREALTAEFPGAEWSPATFFLRNRILRHANGDLSIDQHHHIYHALQRFGLDNANPVRTPLDTNIRLHARRADEGAGDRQLFQELIGTLIYLAGCTRPDVSSAVHRLAQFCADPSTDHVAHAKRVLRYLKGTMNYGLLFRHTCTPANRPYTTATDLELQGFVDSDWAGDTDDRKSQTGLIYTYAGAGISWRSTKQTCTALSSTEAEYLATSDAAREAKWLRRLTEELGFRSGPIPLRIDNSSAHQLAEGSAGSRRTKHIDVRFHFVRECVADGTIRLEHVPTAHNTADTLTKALARPRFDECRTEMGVHDLSDAIRAACIHAA